MGVKGGFEVGNERVRMEPMVIILDASGMDMVALDKRKRRRRR